MQRLIDVAYKYGCRYDIIFNSSKSQMMVFATRKIVRTVDFSIGSSIMNYTTSYRYLGHIITNKQLEGFMAGITRYLGNFNFAQIRLRISYFLAIAAMSSYVLCG